MNNNVRKQPTSSSQSRKMRLYGQVNSPEAYALRDFLNRSVVEFDWVELTCDADCHNELGLPSLENVRLPVVELPTGERMFAPTVHEVAERLGWVTQPRFKEYDLSIYGAGPAGLSAAVYAASEGLRTVLVERQAIGGQAGTSSLIENYLKPARKCVEGSRKPELSAQWVDVKRPSVPRRFAQDSRAGQRILCGTTTP